MTCHIYLSLQVTWLEGHSLAQTVFTNLYSHNPSLVEDRTLKALTLALLKMVDLVKDRVIKAGVFEEVRKLRQSVKSLAKNI